MRKLHLRLPETTTPGDEPECNAMVYSIRYVSAIYSSASTLSTKTISSHWHHGHPHASTMMGGRVFPVISSL